MATSVNDSDLCNQSSFLGEWVRGVLSVSGGEIGRVTMVDMLKGTFRGVYEEGEVLEDSREVEGSVGEDT